jgi:uncharacterized protein (DUF697 family)/predicted GTPase
VVNEIPDELRGQFTAKFEEAGRKIGRFNLAVFGKTGVGKSTLVNAIFGEEIAQTGIGSPVTLGQHLYLHVSGHFGMLDTRGIEIGTDSKTILGELERYVQETRRQPLAEQVHVAWYCVRANDLRLEDTEAEFIAALARLGLPVLLVFTQVEKRDGRYRPDVLELAKAVQARRLPLARPQIFPTYARADPDWGLEQHGLQELLDATFLVAPDGVEAALTASQKIDLKRKSAAAQKTIGGAATAAAAVGAAPIPVADAAVLVPIQLGMMATISRIYGIDVGRATTAALAATVTATTTGRTLAGGLLKLVPGVGTVVGGAITAGVASGLTLAMGQAWLTVCIRMSEGQLNLVGGALDTDAVRDLFKDEFKRQMRRAIGR